MDNRRRIVITAAVAGYLPIKNVTHEENSDEEYQWNQEANEFTRRVRIRGNQRKHVTRIEGYVSTIVCDYAGKQFREHFRMKRDTYENLERILTPDLIRNTENGRFTLDVRTQLLSVLWLLATPDSFR